MDKALDQYSEVEYKYRADNVDLEAFTELMETLKPTDRLMVSSWDYYYINDQPDEFIRFRAGKYDPELTIKRKVKDSNNWVRVEVDLPLSNQLVEKATIDRFVGLLGYQENFAIFKACFIFYVGNVSYVYYKVYNQQMKEISKFIEVEVDKNAIPAILAIGDDPVTTLNEAEKVLEPLGITNKNRLKRSLFELYRR